VRGKERRGGEKKSKGGVHGERGGEKAVPKRGKTNNLISNFTSQMSASMYQYTEEKGKEKGAMNGRNVLARGRRKGER